MTAVSTECAPSTELVGPMQRIVFVPPSSYRSRAAVVRMVPRLPRDTMDPRVPLCWDHHTACVCREALLAENLQEVSGEWKALRSALEKRIAGHPTYVDPDTDAAYDCRYRQLNPWVGHGPAQDDRIEYRECSCIGCQVWREARPW